MSLPSAPVHPAPPIAGSPAAPDTLALLAAFGDAVSEPVLFLDAGLRLVHANRAGAALLASGAAGAAGAKAPTLAASVRAALGRALTAGESSLLVVAEDAPALDGRWLRLRSVGAHVAVVVAPDAVPSISDVVRQLNQALDYGRIVSLVAHHAAELLGARRAGVFTLDGELLVCTGRAGDSGVAIGERLPLAATLAGRAVLTRRPARVSDVRVAADRWPRLAEDAARDPRPNALAVPLLLAGHPIGAVCVAGRDAGPFDGVAERLLGKLAEHAAIAVENARLYATAARTARHASILADAARELLRHDAPAALLDGVAHLAVDVFHADGACVYRTDVERETVEVAFRAGAVAALAPDALRHRFWARVPGEVARSGRPRFVEDLATLDPSHTPRLAGAPPAVGALAVLPLRAEGRTDGVLVLHHATPRAFPDPERALLADFATLVSVGLRNATLLALRQREQELSEASAEIARLALASDDPGAVAAAVLAVVDRVVPTPGKALIAHGTGETVEFLAATGFARVHTGLRLPHAESMVRHVEPGAVLRVDDLRTLVHPLRRAQAPAGPAVLVPLGARQRVIGTLVASSAGDAAIDDARLAELVRLAASVALALDAVLLAGEERRRTARERELATALATMDQPVLVLGRDGCVRHANRAAEREYGYTLAELTGMPIGRLAPAGRAPTPAWGTPAIGAPGAIGTPGGAPGLLQTTHRRRDGSEFPVAVARSVIRDERGAPVGEVLGVRNLSEERRLTEQLRQHEKLAALGSIVAGVAHELNNPLTGISAFSQLLLEEGLGDEQAESVRLIKREADRAVGVIRDLLLFARKTGSETGAVDVNALIALAVRLRGYGLRAAGVEVVLDLDPAAPRVVGDEQRLQQVLLNLIVNAEQAMDAAAERRLTLCTRGQGDTLVLEVRDTGSGMTPATLAHVFEPFFTTKPAGTGTGLGLSVSYGIVQAHGGTIVVDSTPGCGASFRITLPLAGADARPDLACT